MESMDDTKEERMNRCKLSVEALSQSVYHIAEIQKLQVGETLAVFEGTLLGLYDTVRLDESIILERLEQLKAHYIETNAKRKREKQHVKD